LEKQIGKVPWKVYKQVPRDFCMLVWRIHRNYILSKVCCRFNRFQDRAYTNVDAHELAHQWFGDLITAKTVNIIGYKRGFTLIMLLAEKRLGR
jgi:aminopeptidase N